MGRSEVDSTTDSNGILRACYLKPWETGKSGILRLVYCQFYCFTVCF